MERIVGYVGFWLFCILIARLLAALFGVKFTLIPGGIGSALAIGFIVLMHRKYVPEEGV
jgi:hypothetical protein